MSILSIVYSNNLALKIGKSIKRIGRIKNNNRKIFKLYVQRLLCVHSGHPNLEAKRLLHLSRQKQCNKVALKENHGSQLVIFVAKQVSCEFICAVLFVLRTVCIY